MTRIKKLFKNFIKDARHPNHHQVLWLIYVLWGLAMFGLTALLIWSEGNILAHVGIIIITSLWFFHNQLSSRYDSNRFYFMKGEISASFKALKSFRIDVERDQAMIQEEIKRQEALATKRGNKKQSKSVKKSRKKK